MKDNNRSNKLTIALLIIYLVAIFWIIVLKLNVHFSYMGNLRRINLIPFSEPVILNGKLDFGEMIMNILIFIPSGIYLEILFKRWRIGKKLFFIFLISLLCETTQLILAIGAFDITDIINNTLGGMIGLMIYKGIDKAFNNSLKAQKFTNILAATATVSMILFLYLLRTNRLWIRYQ